MYSAEIAFPLQYNLLGVYCNGVTIPFAPIYTEFVSLPTGLASVTCTNNPELLLSVCVQSELILAPSIVCAPASDEYKVILPSECAVAEVIGLELPRINEQ